MVLFQSRKQARGIEDGMLPPIELLEGFAIFMDGMARAVVLPIGPTLVHRLIHDAAVASAAADSLVVKEDLEESWSSISYRLAAVVAIYVVGRALGTALCQRLSISRQNLHRYVARLGGAAIALQLFSIGSGMPSVVWLAALRFCSSVIAGLLCGITGQAGGAVATVHREEHVLVDPSNGPSANLMMHYYSSGSLDFTDPQAAIIFLSGFSLSLLLGGLVYGPVATDSTVHAMTGANQFTWSPLFLAGMAVLAEVGLRTAFAKLALFRPSNTNGHNYERMTPLRTRMRSPGVTFGTPADDTGREVSFKDDLHLDLESMRHQTPSHDQPRQRTASTTSAYSANEYFDCHSEMSDCEIPLDDDDTENNDNYDQQEFAQYMDGKCVYEAGSPAYVPAGDSPSMVPVNFLDHCRGNVMKAQKMWIKTQQWRCERDVWRMHSLPANFFFDIKKAYPHFTHGLNKEGYPVVYEQPGKMALKELLQTGCTIRDMVNTNVFFQEYLCNCICASPESREMRDQMEPHNSSCYGYMVVMDIKGAGVSLLNGDVLKYLKAVSDINSNYYPLTMKHVFIINAPWWASGVFSTVKNILPESVRVDLCSEAKHLEIIQKYIDLDQIPSEYGGSSPHRLDEHPLEKDLHALVERANKCEEDPEGPHKFTPSVLISKTQKHLDMSPAPQIGLMDMSQTPGRMTSINEEPYHSRAVGHTVEIESPQLSTTRRRIGIGMRANLMASEEFDDIPDDKKCNMDLDLVFASIMCLCWSAAEGAIELSLPLWISSPGNYGGLDLSPRMSGVTMFCCVVLLLLALKTRLSALASHIPQREPLRAFRIAVGSQAASIGFLLFVPLTFSNLASAIVATVSILVFMGLAGLLGQVASTTLHRIVANEFVRHSGTRLRWSSNCYDSDRFFSDCGSGRLTRFIQNVGYVAGIFLVAPLWTVSLCEVIPKLCTFSVGLLFPSSTLFLLYAWSFTVKLNANGELVSRSRGSCRQILYICCSSLVEALKVSVGDFASLMDSSTWSNPNGPPVAAASGNTHLSSFSADSLSVPPIGRSDGVATKRTPRQL